MTLAFSRRISTAVLSTSAWDDMLHTRRQRDGLGGWLAYRRKPDIIHAIVLSFCSLKSACYFNDFLWVWPCSSLGFGLGSLHMGLSTHIITFTFMERRPLFALCLGGTNLSILFSFLIYTSCFSRYPACSPYSRFLCFASCFPSTLVAIL